MNDKFLYWCAFSVRLSIILTAILIFAASAHPADPVILNLEWDPRGDWSSFRVEVKDSEGYIYTYEVGTAKEYSLTLDSGEIYLIELSGVDKGSGDRVVLSNMEWVSRVRREGFFSDVD